MTCERCENVPDNVIESYIKQKRIQELKAELAELEGKPNYTARGIGPLIRTINKPVGADPWGTYG